VELLRPVKGVCRAAENLFFAIAIGNTDTVPQARVMTSVGQYFDPLRSTM
jgi:hypothetical protein